MDEKEAPKPGVISDEVFKRETDMCRKLHSKRNGRCCWGECAKCGVIPLLYKLHKNELLEEPEEVERVKREILTEDLI